MVKQASKLTDLSYTNFIMLLYREALDRLRVRSNIILLLLLLSSSLLLKIMKEMNSNKILSFSVILSRL